MRQAGPPARRRERRLGWRLTYNPSGLAGSPGQHLGRSEQVAGGAADVGGDVLMLKRSPYQTVFAILARSLYTFAEDGQMLLILRSMVPYQSYQSPCWTIGFRSISQGFIRFLVKYSFREYLNWARAKHQTGLRSNRVVVSVKCSTDTIGSGDAVAAKWGTVRRSHAARVPVSEGCMKTLILPRVFNVFRGTGQA